MRYLLIIVVSMIVLDMAHIGAQTQFGTEEHLTLDVSAKDPLFVDFNGDGHIDIIDYDDSGIVLKLNNGVDGFNENNTIHYAADASTIRTEDLDQDGDHDLLFMVKTIPYQRKLGILWNNGDGQVTLDWIDLEAGIVLVLQIDDLDNDGLLDIIALYQESESLWYDAVLYKQTASGNFEDGLLLFNQYDNSSMRIYDFDSDGDKDFLSLYGFSTQKLCVKKNIGGGIWEWCEEFIGLDNSITNFDLVDFDLDGDNDLLLTNTSTSESVLSSELVLFENRGTDGHLAINILSLEINDAFLDFTYTDIDGDGDTDIIYVDTMNQELWFIRNLGNFEFSEPTPIGTTDILIVGGIDCLDWDNDGDPDILVSQSNNSNTSLFQNMPALPSASFEYIHCQGELVNTSTTFFPNSTMLWDFGNGNQSTAVEPAVVLIEELGYHIVSLTVCNETGCDSKSEVIDLSQAIHIDLPLEGRVNEPIVFADYSPGYTNRSWVFGDGNVSTDAIALNSYDEIGTYELELFLTNSTIQDCTKHIKQEIEISPGQDCDENNSDYQVNFDVPAVADTGEEVIFNDYSEGFTDWIWQFGDGSFSNTQSSSHIYNAPGLYTVQLTLKDATETTCSSSYSAEILIVQKPVDDFRPIAGGATTVFSGSYDWSSFLLYPNPCMEECLVSLPSFEKWQLELFNADGQEVFSENLEGDHFKFDSKSFMPGIYLVQITDSNGVSAKSKLLLLRQ